MTTTHTWKGASGPFILDPTQYNDGTAFAPGDTLVVSSGDPTIGSAGSNVLDGGLGSNFVTGATGADGGTDAFFLDGAAGTTWDTIANFHPGDSATL